MTNRVNQSVNETEELIDVPMIIETESISYYKKLGYKVESYLLGNRRVPCVYVKGTQSFKDDYIRMLDNERKKEDRRNRCLIADGKGGMIMCPECNKCNQCKKRESFDFSRNHDLSYEKLVEGDTDEDKTFDVPDPRDEIGDSVFLDIIDDLVMVVGSKNKEYGQILEMLLDQKGTSEVAKELNFPWSTAKDRIKKVQSLAQELFGNRE